MTRFALAAIEKRIERFEKRARLLNLPPLVITYTGDWTAEDRQAYATADDAERSRLEDKYLPDLPDHPDPLGIRGIVVVRAERPPDVDDEDDDLPAGMSAADYEAAKRKRDALLAEMQVEALFAEPTETVIGDPRDPNPDGDPDEILYIDQRTGYPVSRAEHQRKREQQHSGYSTFRRENR